MIDITTYKHSEFTFAPNYKEIPVNLFPINDIGAKKFNEIIDYIREKDITLKIERTPSGGIKKDAHLLRPKYDIIPTRNSVEITLLTYDGFYRFQFRTELPDLNDSSKLSGTTAFRIFKRMCLKDGIDLDAYKIDNGEEVKAEIESPLIKLETNVLSDIVINNVNHIDFHNSYPAGLINTHPEFTNVIKFCYLKRKENPIYKSILNFSIGYMQSIQCCNARWAHLSKDAIADNNKRMKDLALRLKAAGRTVICYNTDGIWYSGKIFHGNGEGSEIGQWSNDHKDCTFRAKSAGCYEFIENGVYYPVVRGYTRLDTIKPRTEWTWGDIYSTEIEELKYIYVDEEGIFRDGKRI